MCAEDFVEGESYCMYRGSLAGQFGRQNDGKT